MCGRARSGSVESIGLDALGMPKTTPVDLHAFLDACEAERDSRTSPLVRVYRRGMEPLDWHEQCWNRPVRERGRPSAGPLSELSPASLATAAGPAGPARSRSPVRGAGPGVDGVLDEQWSWQFDGQIRPCRHGLVLGVDDALVAEGLDPRRSLFVDAFAENRVLDGNGILRRCRDLHRVGRCWDDVSELCEDLRDVARAELRGGPGAAVARMRLLPRCRAWLLVGSFGYRESSR